MKQYRLPVIIHQPEEDTENRYLAEIPLLSGCRAWGDTPAEALEIVRSVAAEFIRSYKEHKQSLPTIPNWGSHDLKPGTISGILSSSDITYFVYQPLNNDELFLRGEDYPTLVNVWNNKDDDIFDNL